MLKKTITYVDYDDVERTEDFYFNISKAELMEMEMSVEGGMEKYLRKIVAAKEGPQIADMFKKIITMSYGEKSPDGKRFIKSKELTEAFTQTEAYSELFMKLTTDADYAAEFVNAILPKLPDKEPQKA